VLHPETPVIEMQIYVGNLGLNSGAPQNVNQLNTAAMTPYFSNAQVIPIALGQTQQLPIATKNGKNIDFSISFPSVTQYSLFQVNDDQGVLLIYTSFILVNDRAAHQALPAPIPRASPAQAPPADRPRPSAGRSDSSGEPQAPEREPASV